jgi:filamentous hemagglutinin
MSAPRTRMSALRASLLTTTAAACLAAGLAGQAVALPVGPVVTGPVGNPGAATFAFQANQLDVNQTVPLAVINWTSFNVANGETVNFNLPNAGSIAFNRIPANAPITMNGALNSNGGVWLLSPGGLIIGSNAKVNVGSFVGLAGTIGTDITPYLQQDVAQPPNHYTIKVTGILGAGKNVTVLPGAQIRASSGFVALQGEQIVQNGDIIASDAVSFIVGQTGQITYEVSAAGQRLAIVQAGGAPAKTPTSTQQPRLDHGGSSKGLWVSVDATTGALAPGFTGLINLDGVVQATGVKPGSANGGVVLLAGSDQSASSINVDTAGASITSNGSLVVRSDSAVLGAATVGGLDVSTFGGVSLAAPISAGAAGALLNVNSPTGAIAFNSNLTVTGALTATSKGAISVGSGAAVQGLGGGDLQLSASNGFTAAASSLLSGGSVADVSITSGSLAQGADLIAGSITGRTVLLTAYGKAGGGALSLKGAVNAALGASIIGNTAQGPLALTVSAPITSGGAIDLASNGGGALTVNANLTAAGAINGSGKDIAVGAGSTLRTLGVSDLQLTAQGSFTAAASSQILGGAGASPTTANVTIIAGAAGPGGDLSAGGLISGRDVTLTDYGKAGGGALSVLAPITAGHTLSIAGNPLGASPGPIAVNIQAPIASGGSIDLRSVGGQLTIGADVAADGGVSGSGDDVSLAGGVTVQSDAKGTGAGDLTLTARTGFNAPASSRLIGGASIGAPTGNVSVTAGSAGAGADLAAGQIAGKDVALTAWGKSGGGAVTLAGAINASHSVTVAANPAAGAAAIQVLAPIVSGGAIDLHTAGGALNINAGLTADGAIIGSGQSVTLAPAVVVRSDAKGTGAGDLQLTAQANFAADPTTQLFGGSGAAAATANVSITAGSASSGGDLAAGQISGKDVSLTAYGKTGGGTLTLGGAINAGHNVAIAGNPGGAGQGPVTVKIASPVTSAGSISLRSYGGRLTIDANLTADGDVDGSGDDVTVGSGVTVRSDAKGAGVGVLQLSALRSFTADAASRLIGGSSALSPTGNVLVTAGTAGLGADLVAGQISGKDVSLTAFGQSGGGVLTLGGAINASHNVTIAGNPGGAGQGPVTVKIASPVTSAGSISLRSYGGRLTIDAGLMADGDIDGSGDDVSVGSGVTVQADAKGAGAGAIQLSALRSFNAAASSWLIGGSLAAPMTGNVTITSGASGAGADLIAGQISGRAVQLTAYGKAGGSALTLGGAINAGQGLTVTGSGPGAVALTVSAPLVSGGPASLTTTGLLAFNSGVSAGGALTGTGQDITVGSGVVLRSDAQGSGGDMTLTAQGNFTAAANSQLLGGAGAAPTTANVSVTAGAGAGGDLAAGQISGGDVALIAQGKAGGSALTLAGAINAGQALTVTGSGPGAVALTVSAPLVSGGPASLTTTGLLAFNSGVSAGGALTGTGQDITVGTGVVLRSDAQGFGGDMTLTARGNFTADATSQLLGGAGLAPTTANVSVTAGAGAGGDLAAGQISGGDVALIAQGKAGGSALTLAGAINAGQGLTVTGSGPGAVALTVSAPLVSGGATNLTTTGLLTINSGISAGGPLAGTGQNVTVGPGVVLRSDAQGVGGGDLTLTALGNFTAAASSQLLGGAGAAPTTANVMVTAIGDLIAGQISGKDVTLSAGGGVLTLGGAINAGHSLTVAGAGPGPAALTVSSPVVAGGSINLTTSGLLAINSAVSAGGALTGSGQAITVGPGVALRSGAQGLGGGDLQLTSLGDFTADATSQFLGGAGLAPATANVSITAGSPAAGGNLLAGQISGKNVTLTAYGKSGGGIISLASAINAAQALTVTGVGPGALALTVSGPATSGGAMALLTNGALLVNSSLTAGGALTAQAQAITVSAGVALRSDSQGAGGGGLQLTAFNDVTADPTSRLLGGAGASPTSANVLVAAGTGGAGDLLAGQISGKSVVLSGSGKPGGGLLTLAGAINAGQSVTATGAGPGPVALSVLAPITSGGSIGLQTNGALIINSGLTADGAITGWAQKLSIAPAVTLRSDAKGAGAGDLQLTALGDFTADATSRLFGGAGLAPTSASVSVAAGTGGSGGDLLAGQISGKSVALLANGKAGGGLLTLAGAVNGGQSVTAMGVGPGAVALNVLAPVSSGGAITLQTNGALLINSGVTADGAVAGSGQDITIAPTVAIRSDAKGAGAGDLQLTALGNITAAANSQLLGGAGSAPATANVLIAAGTGAAGGDLLAGQIAGKDVALMTSGKAGGGTLTLAGAVSAGHSVSAQGAGPGAVALNVLAPVTSGGAIYLQTNGALKLNSGLTADGAITGSAQDIAVAPAVVVRSDAKGAGAGDLLLTAVTGFTADPTSLLAGGSAASATTARVAVEAGSSTLGGDLLAGRISGKDVELYAYGKSGGGALTIAGAITAGHSVTAMGNPGGAAQGPVTLKVSSPITSGGTIFLRSFGGNLVLGADLSADGDVDGLADDLSVGAVTVRADAQGAGAGAVKLSARNSYTAHAVSQLVGGSLAQPTTGDVIVSAGFSGQGGDLTAGQISGKDVVLTSLGKAGGSALTLASAVTASHSVRVTGGPGGLGQGPVTLTVQSPIVSGGLIDLSSNGAMAVNANLTADGAATGFAQDISIAPGVTVRSDAKGLGAGDLQLTALGGYAADSTSLLSGGSGALSADVSVVAGQGAAGGDLLSGQISGKTVHLIAFGKAGGSALTMAGAVNASQNVSVFGAGSGLVAVQVSSPVVSAGSIDLHTNGALTINADLTADGAFSGSGQDITLAPAVTVRADAKALGGGDLRFNAAGDFTAAASSFLAGGAGAAPTTADVSVRAGSSGAGGDLLAGLVLGKDVRLESLGKSGGGVLTLQSAVNAGNSVSVTGDPAAAGVAAGPVTVTVQSPITSGGTIGLASNGGALIVNADVTADGALTGSGQSITIAPAVTVRSDARGQGAGDLTLAAQTSFTAAPTSLLAGGAGPAPATADVSIAAGSSTAGADLIAGKISGKAIQLTSYGKTGGGLLTIGGAVSAGKSVTIWGDPGGLAQGPVAVTISSPIVSGGPIELKSVGGSILIGADLTADTDIDGSGDDITLSAGVTAQADAKGAGAGVLQLAALKSYAAAASSQLIGGASAAAPTADVLITAGKATGGADLVAGRIAGRDVRLTSYGKPGGAALTLGGAINASRSVTVTGDPGGFGPGPVALKVLAPVTSGGSIDLASNGGSAAIAADLAAVGAVTVSGQGISIAPAVTVRSDANGAGGGDLTLTALGDVNADASSQLLGGSGGAPSSANVTVTAGTAAAGGDLAVGQISGRNVLLTAYGKSGGAGALTLAGAITAARDVTVTADPAGAGQGALALKVLAPVSAGGAIDLRSSGGALVIGANLTGDGAVSGAGQDISVSPGVTVRSDAKGLGASNLQLAAVASFNAAASSQLVGGSIARPTSANVTVTAGGGDLLAGQVSGADVLLSAYGKAGGSSLTLAGAVASGQGLTVLGNPGGVGPGPVAIKSLANLTSGAGLEIRGQGGGDMTIGAGARLSAAGDVYLDSSANLAVSGQVSGRALSAVAGQTLTIGPGGSLTATGASSAPGWPNAPKNLITPAPSDSQMPAMTGLTLASASLDLQGAVSALGADVYVQPLGSPSSAVIGGAAGQGGFQLSNAQVARIAARNLLFLGASNVTVQDLTIDPARISGLWVGTAGDKTVQVLGAVTGGAVAVNIGFVLNGPAGMESYIPAGIDVIGGLGASSSRLGAVGLMTRGDILIGSSAFVSAAKADPAFDAVASSRTLPSPAKDYVFITADTLQLAASGRIIQQNTAGNSLSFSGVDVDAPTSTQVLVNLPPGLTAAPTTIDLFGAVTLTDASVVNDSRVAGLANLLAPPISALSVYRFNGCAFGSTCLANGPAAIVLPTIPSAPPPAPPAPPAGDSGGGDSGGGDSGGDSGGDQGGPNGGNNVFATFNGPGRGGGGDLSDEPITASGNNDLWTGPSRDENP